MIFCVFDLFLIVGDKVNVIFWIYGGRLGLVWEFLDLIGINSRVGFLIIVLLVVVGNF